MNYEFDNGDAAAFIAEVDEQKGMQMRIILAMEEEDLQMAETFLDEYEMEFGQDEFLFMARIDTAEAADDPARMKELIDMAADFLGETPLLELRYARYYFYLTRYEEALEHIQKAEFDEQSDSYLAVQHIKGFTYILLERYKEALQAFEDVLMDFYDPRIGMLCGLMYYEMGKTERAWEYVEKAMQSNCDHDPELAQYISTLEGDPQKALDNSSRLIEYLTQSNPPANAEEKEIDRFVMEMVADPQKAMEIRRVSDKLPPGGEKEFLQLMSARAMDEIGEHGLAQTTLRKLVTSAITPDPYGDYTVSLAAHITALMNAHYSDAWINKYMMKWSDQLKDEPVCQLHLAVMSRKEGLEKPFWTAFKRLDPDYNNFEYQQGLYLLMFQTAVNEGEYPEALELLEDEEEDEGSAFIIPDRDTYLFLLGAMLGREELFDVITPSEMAPSVVAAVRYCGYLLMDEEGQAGMELVHFAKTASQEECSGLMELLQDDRFDSFDLIRQLLYYKVNHIEIL